MISAEHMERLPIFPLSRATLFPHALLPLHIFEPRYRAMTEHCLRDGRPMAIAMVHEGEQSGLPTVHPEMGMGVIERHERLPDGRFHIVLRGLGRVRIVREWPQQQAWREVEAAPLCDRVEDFGVVAGHMATLRGCLQALQRMRPDLASSLAQLAPEDEPPGAVADRLAMSFFPESEPRQALIAEPLVEARLERVVERVGEVLARLGAADGGVFN